MRFKDDKCHWCFSAPSRWDPYGSLASYTLALKPIVVNKHSWRVYNIKVATQYCHIGHFYMEFRRQMPARPTWITSDSNELNILVTGVALILLWGSRSQLAAWLACPSGNKNVLPLVFLIELRAGKHCLDHILRARRLLVQCAAITPSLAGCYIWIN